jgi:hypothetical protein
VDVSTVQGLLSLQFKMDEGLAKSTSPLPATGVLPGMVYRPSVTAATLVKGSNAQLKAKSTRETMFDDA